MLAAGAALQVQLLTVSSYLHTWTLVTMVTGCHMACCWLMDVGGNTGGNRVGGGSGGGGADAWDNAGTAVNLPARLTSITQHSHTKPYRAR